MSSEMLLMWVGIKDVIYDSMMLSLSGKRAKGRDKRGHGDAKDARVDSHE